MSQKQDNLPMNDFSQSDNESMITACWYVAYADGRLHREVKLMRSIANQLQVGEAVARTIKKRVAAGKLKPQAPVDIEARRFLLPLLLQVATNDGRLTVAEQSAVRRLGQLMKLGDEFIDEQVSAIDTKGDRVKPLGAKRPSKRVPPVSSPSAPSDSEMAVELERLVQSDQANVPAKASPIAAIFMILLGNLTPVVGLMFFDWRVFPLLALFWVENVIIGIVNTFKMEAARGQGMPGCFFAVHYGGFCLGHGLFICILFGSWEGLGGNGTSVLLQVALFAVAILTLIIEHAYLAFRFVATRQNERVTRDRLVLESYGRIIAVHTTLLLGAWLAEVYDQMQPILLMLVGIKMFFDLIGWVIDLPPIGRYGRLRQACGDGAGAMIAAGMLATFLIALPATIISQSITAFLVAPAIGVATGFGVGLHRLLGASVTYMGTSKGARTAVVAVPVIIVGIATAYGLDQAARSFSEAEQAAFKRKQERERDEQLKRNRPHEQARQRAAALAKEKLEANRRTNPSRKEVEARASDVNLALRGEYSCSQTRSTNAHLAFDEDEATAWESSIDDRFVQAKLTVQWEDSVTINKVVLKQRHDRLMYFRFHVIDEQTGDWRQRFGLNGPKHYAPFWFPDRKRWDSRRSLVELDGQLLSEQKDRVIGGAPDSDSLNTYTIYFPEPIATRGFQLHIIEASQSPVQIAELMVY